MVMNKDILISLGLTEDEATIYTVLIEEGPNFWQTKSKNENF
jgi:sugar-specific transcriptional regulator TrmB